MTVKALIELLSEQDPDLEVVMASDPEGNGFHRIVCSDCLSEGILVGCYYNQAEVEFPDEDEEPESSSDEFESFLGVDEGKVPGTAALLEFLTNSVVQPSDETSILDLLETDRQAFSEGTPKVIVIWPG